MSDDALKSSAVALGCLLRHIPLFFRETRKTPLRVLCIAALDTIHVLRHSQPISPHRIDDVAMFLDFQALTNADCDHKDMRCADWQALRMRLERAGLGGPLEAYLVRLRAIESRRPAIGGGHRDFDEARIYREDVVRISLAAAAAVALNTVSVSEALWSIQEDADLESLFRIVMQCQVIDDVLDYADDRAAGLPSFLTSTASRRVALHMTAGVARAYGTNHERPSGPSALPIRLALRATTAVTVLVVSLARWGVLRYSWPQPCKSPTASSLVAAHQAPRRPSVPRPNVMASRK